MKCLICGKNSYVGKSLINNLRDRQRFTELDMRYSDWMEFDYSDFETIIYVAAIVHQPDLQNATLYKQVNEDLPVNVAKLAVEQGVKHFVFFSTMAVYGLSPSMTGGGRVSKQTSYHPSDLYGISKLNAEIRLVELQRKMGFTLSILRPPNIYGEGCPGNYYKYMKLCAKYMLLFPLIRHNKFSMIHIDELARVIDSIISNRESGVFCPQDIGTKSNPVRIAKMAKKMNRMHIQSLFLGKLLSFFYRIFPFKKITNLFGDMYYDESVKMPIAIDYINYPNLIKYKDETSK